MLPAHERLESGDRTTSQAEDRLIGEDQLLALDRALEVDLELEALDDRGVHLGLEHRVAPLAAALGAVHRQVRVPKQGLGAGRSDCNADAGADVDLAAAQLEGRVERVEDPLRRARGVAGLGHLLDQDRELVAAQPRDRVGRSHALRDPLGGKRQQPVTGAVSEAVVDGLEPVEITEQDTGLMTRPVGARQRVSQPVKQERPVRQPRERVVEGLMQRVLNGAGVVQRQARVLGQRQHDLLIARAVLAPRLS